MHACMKNTTFAVLAVCGALLTTGAAMSTNAAAPSGPEEVVFRARFIKPDAALPLASSGQVELTAEINRGKGWRNGKRAFVAPVDGLYHFDATVSLSGPADLSCTYFMKLEHTDGAALSQQWNLARLSTRAVDVLDRLTPVQVDGAWHDHGAASGNDYRPSSYEMKQSAGIVLKMAKGEKVRLLVTGGTGTCATSATLSGGSTGDTFMSGFLVARTKSGAG